LACYAQCKLKQKGINLRLNSPVKRLERNTVILNEGMPVEAETIIWSAGNGPHPFTGMVWERLGIHSEKGFRFPVDECLRIKSKHSGIYAIGDCSSLNDKRQRLLPATAQVAMKEGAYLAKSLSQSDLKDPTPFHYASMGMLASLGSGSAIADLGSLQFKGVLAWWFWKAAYLTRLVSLRNKVSVFFDWIKVRLFGRNTSRIDI